MISVGGTFSIPLGNGSEFDFAPRKGLAATRGSWPLREYIADDENALLRTLLPALERDDATFRPLVLYGPTSSGKTSLAFALARRFKEIHAQAKLLLFTAVDFARAYAHAVDTDATDEFRQRFLQSAFVVIDDLQHLEGKSAAQLELRQLLEILPNHDTHLVLTSRTAPSDLDFPADLRSRLGQGLVLPLRWPGQEARCEIIQRYLADRKRGIVLDQGPTLKSVENLAHSFPGSPSRLFAALAQLVHVAEVEQRPLDDRLIEEFLSASEESQITPRQIIAVVAKQRGVTVKDLKGPSRRQAINEARGIAMYLIRRLTTQTFEQIGEHFSGRDHTTVMHACEKTAERLAADPRLQQAVEQITSLLQEEI